MFAVVEFDTGPLYVQNPAVEPLVNGMAFYALGGVCLLVALGALIAVIGLAVKSRPVKLIGVGVLIVSLLLFLAIGVVVGLGAGM